MLVASSTCIIYFAKVGRLDLLKAVYGKVLVPGGVYNEAVKRGKEREFIDAGLIEKAIEKGLIEVKELSKSQKKEIGRLCSLAAYPFGLL
jgi:predicted nucleic acid-binding protein